jgi:hypothetical protein
MVPDIAVFAPAIRSIFGQHGRHDSRYIPFDIADLQERGNNRLLVAMEWLLRVQRCALSEVRDLLDVPAVAARFNLDADDMLRLAQWLSGAGVRWGLDHAQRDSLGLGASGEQTWLFGLRRMRPDHAAAVSLHSISSPHRQPDCRRPSPSRQMPPCNQRSRAFTGYRSCFTFAQNAILRACRDRIVVSNASCVSSGRRSTPVAAIFPKRTQYRAACP